MSHRASHRILAQELRLDRRQAGRPVDPSQRERAPRQAYSCPCGLEFQQPWQRRLHAELKACANDARIDAGGSAAVQRHNAQGDTAATVGEQ